MTTRLSQLLGAIALACAGPLSLGAGQAEHVVIVVWDGMRPDFVTPQLTPTLYELAQRGTFFNHHHSSYVSSTEVNGAAITTGMYPSHDGIMANSQYRPDLNWLSPYGTESFDAIRRGDLLTDGHYLEAATLPEILQAAGFATVTAGAKPVVLLQDRTSSKTNSAARDSVILFRGQTLPRTQLQSLVHLPGVGPFPTEPSADSRKARIIKWLRAGQDKVFLGLYGRTRSIATSRAIDAWTTGAVIDGLWKDGVPKYTLLWLSEPDASQHQSGAGSENAQGGLAECDKNLGRVLRALQRYNVLDRTDIFVVSDHGFSTVDRGPDLAKPLKRAGFTAGKQFENPEPGDVLFINLGGTTFFYVFGRHEETIRRLVSYLQSTDFAGVIFSAVTIEGTFPLSQVHLDAPQGAPDLAVSMRWSRDRNKWGAPGLLTAIEGKAGHGTHASLSPFDLHNTLIAAGPDFKKAFTSDWASGNVDIAPTVLHILGVPQPKPMDGRVLTEAMTESETALIKPQELRIEASRDLGSCSWTQFLKLTRVGPVTYYDEGSGESRPK